MSMLAALARHGTGVCWGVSSEYQAAVVAAGMRYIPLRSGMSAGFAADASAQLSGAPGLVAAPADLGVLSMIPGMASASGSGWAAQYSEAATQPITPKPPT